MTKPPTLNGLKQLEKSGFGKPYPRHGLKLLHWFAHDCLYFDDYNKMCWQYDPEEGYFGFHLFENRFDKHYDQLLPEVYLKYYEVGNLGKPGADDLPDYVLEDYIKKRNHCNNNMDRIIVSVDDECFDRVYVTEHSDRTDFNKEATYCISRGLIMKIRELTLENFLTETGYQRLRKANDQGTGYLTMRTNTDQGTEEDSDQEIGNSTLQKNTVGNNGYSRLTENDNIGYHNEYENCCRCIIL